MHDKLPLFDTVDSINDFKKLFKVLYPKINLGEYTLSVEVNPSYSKDVTFYKFSEYVRYNLEKYSENRCEVVDRYSIYLGNYVEIGGEYVPTTIQITPFNNNLWFFN